MNIEELIAYLSDFTTPERVAMFRKVLDDRTRYATVVVEDLFQAHNYSAVLRSCDCFGLQDVHIIENYNEYVVSQGVAAGASKWLDVHRHNEVGRQNTVNTLQQLKVEGYRIVATTPHTNDILINDFDVTAGKFALVFGNEKMGISDEVRAEADEFVRIPMYGFTESFNISVSAALCLQYAANALRQHQVDWQLKEEEKKAITLEWLRRSIKNVEMIEERFSQSE